MSASMLYQSSSDDDDEVHASVLVEDINNREYDGSPHLMGQATETIFMRKPAKGARGECFCFGGYLRREVAAM